MKKLALILALLCVGMTECKREKKDCKDKNASCEKMDKKCKNKKNDCGKMKTDCGKPKKDCTTPKEKPAKEKSAKREKSKKMDKKAERHNKKRRHNLNEKKDVPAATAQAYTRDLLRRPSAEKPKLKTSGASSQSIRMNYFGKKKTPDNK